MNHIIRVKVRCCLEPCTSAFVESEMWTLGFRLFSAFTVRSSAKDAGSWAETRRNTEHGKRG